MAKGTEAALGKEDSKQEDSKQVDLSQSIWGLAVIYRLNADKCRFRYWAGVIPVSFLNCL